MIIAISGSVGCGKTSLAKKLAKKLNFKLVHLNELAKKFKIEDVENLQTFDFDLDKLLDLVEEDIKFWRKNKENVIIEGHFAHDLNSDLVDKLIIISRPLNLLKEEYEKRGYNLTKINENLEVESFNLCFYESIENGYGEESSDLVNLNIKKNSQLKLFENDLSFEKLVLDVEKFVKN